MGPNRDRTMSSWFLLVLCDHKNETKQEDGRKSGQLFHVLSLKITNTESSEESGTKVYQLEKT